MAWLDKYELLTQVAERPPWRIHLAQKVVEGSPYRNAPERFLVRELQCDRADVFTLTLVDEARLAPLLQHDNVERAFECIDNGFVWVTEFFEGWSLEHIIESAPDAKRALSIPGACHLASEVCRALHYLHREARSEDGQVMQVLHKSIGPRAVCVTLDGTVKLSNPVLESVDVLGRSGRANESGPSLEEVVRMSPEHAWGRPVVPSSDVYMTGAFLYEMLTGEPCFQCNTVFDTIRAIRELFVPPPSSLRLEIPKIVDAIVLRTLAKNPGDRQPSARELAWNLELALKTMGVEDGREALLADIEASGVKGHPRPGGL